MSHGGGGGRQKSAKMCHVLFEWPLNTLINENQSKVAASELVEFLITMIVKTNFDFITIFVKSF